MMAAIPPHQTQPSQRGDGWHPAMNPNPQLLQPILLTGTRISKTSTVLYLQLVINNEPEAYEFKLVFR